MFDLTTKFVVMLLFKAIAYGDTNEQDRGRGERCEKSVAGFADGGKLGGHGSNWTSIALAIANIGDAGASLASTT
jgi:hypothetical protein